MRTVLSWGVVVTVVLTAALPAGAQVTATGRAFGTQATLAGAPFDPLNIADTGPQSGIQGTASPDFDVAVQGATVPLAPLANVNSEGSTTQGLASGTDSFVDSVGSGATAQVLPGQVMGNSLVDVAANGAVASLACNAPAPVLMSGIDALVIAGNPIPLPGEVPPNTTILAAELPLVILNRQTVDRPNATSINVTVEAARVQAIAPVVDLLTLSIAGAAAGLANLPSTCALLQGPQIANATKRAVFVTDGGTRGLAEPGDRLRYTISGQNVGNDAATNLRVIDRVPLQTTVDPATFQLDGSSVVATIANCPADVAFTNRCPGEPATDTTRQCITVTVPSLPAGDTFALSFEATINAGATGDVCNTALIGTTPVTNITDGPGGGPGGGGGSGGFGGNGGPGNTGGDDTLRTAGGPGGCSTGSSGRNRADIWVLFAGSALLWVWSRRRGAR